MKKFTFLMIALFIAAMGFAQTKNLADVKHLPAGMHSQSTHRTYNYAQRQTRDNDQALVVLSVGDVWGDGTGYQLLIDADNEGWSSSSGPDCGSTYTQWEYMIPANASANDANVVINATESLYITPGTYSYLVLNPGCSGGTNWISSNQCDESNATDYTFEAGKMYTFTVALNGNNDCVTLTVEDIPTDPTMTTGTTELAFLAEINSSSDAETVVINAMNLTNEITATVAAPFEVSSDNTTFGTTATLTVAGGNFYVRYSPTATGNHTGTMTVTSTGANDLTIALSGTAYECSVYSAPWTEDFGPESPTIYCWSRFNANNDANYFQFMWVDEGHTDRVAVYPYNSSNSANDWLVSPRLSIGENQRVRFQVANYGYEEKYKVWAITGTPSNYESATLLLDETAVSDDAEFPTMEYVTIDLSSYSGQEIYIGIQCVSDANMYYFFVDNFELSFNPTNAEIALTSVTPANGAAIPSGQDITLSGVVTNNGTTLTSYKVAYTVDGGAAVEYTVSEINVANAATHNFTHATPISGLAIGSHTIVVTVSEPNGTADGDANDNSMTVNITVTAPLAYGCYFEEDPAEEGWSFVDSDNDGNNWTWENSSSTPHMTTYEGIGCIYSASYASVALTPDNWAISPAIQIENGPITVSFYAKGQDADYAAEHFQIYAGTSADVTAMTSVSEEFVATGEYTQYTANLPESYVGQVIYVAIRHFNVSDEFVLVVDNFEVLAYGHVVITDIEENIAESIAVYPNPTSSMVTIANAEGKDIIVVNSLGQVVASIENAAANQTIDVTNFANGTYFVKVDGEVVKLNVVK